MLITKKRIGETIIINNDACPNDPISIELLGMRGHYVNLGIQVPNGFHIYKKEIYENQSAVKNKE
jgi:carbon storage regulator CsrA